MSEEREITAKFSVAELNGWDESAQPSEQYARLLIGAKTDLGCVRENNEDKFEFFIPSDQGKLARKGEFIAVADGMGGHAAGQIASELGLKTLVRSYFADGHADVEGALRMAVAEANAAVFSAASIPGRGGMGSTLTAAVLRGPEMFVAQVGDSRLHLYHNGGLKQITEDHSWVAEQVRLGTMTEEEAGQSPFRNIITRSLGTASSVEPEILKLEVCEGDILLLCSDGLSGVVSRQEMGAVLSANGPSESCQKLVDMALDRGGPDNVTVLIAQILSMDRLVSTEETPAETTMHKKSPLSRLFGGE